MSVFRIWRARGRECSRQSDEMPDEVAVLRCWKKASLDGKFLAQDDVRFHVECVVTVRVILRGDGELVTRNPRSIRRAATLSSAYLLS